MPTAIANVCLAGAVVALYFSNPSSRIMDAIIRWAAPLLLGVVSAKLLANWPASRVVFLPTTFALVLGLVAAVVRNGGDMTMDDEWDLVAMGVGLQMIFAVAGAVATRAWLLTSGT
jgi:hypothetical protein